MCAEAAKHITYFGYLGGIADEAGAGGGSTTARALATWIVHVIIEGKFSAARDILQGEYADTRGPVHCPLLSFTVRLA